MQSIVNKWKIEDNGPAKEFLNIKITCNQKIWMIDLGQRAYIKEIINEWKAPNQKTWVLMARTPTKLLTGPKINDDLKCKYPILVGKLLWVLNTVQPDVCYAVNTLAKHMSRPKQEAMQVALCVIKYLNQTQDNIL